MIETHAQLYDKLQSRYGLGDGPEQHPDEPYFKVRGREVAKLKSTMKRRNMSIDDVELCIDYAERERIPIKAVWQLCELYLDARRAKRNLDREIARHERNLRLVDAAREAWDMGEDAWGDRLYRADADSATAVLADWTERKRALA